MNKLKQVGLALLMSMSIFIVGCVNEGSQESPNQKIEQKIENEIGQQASSEKNTQNTTNQNENIPEKESSVIEHFSLSDISAFSGTPYVVVNDNIPYFTDQELSVNSFENYSELDSLGRCGTAYASIGKDIMPTEKRGPIGHIKPSGWQTAKYDCVDGKYLYNRCHLIGFQLAAENHNEKNLITGTRYMNVDGMLPFENMVADYVKETGNHVQYRVTPIYDGNNPVATGVLMEGKSVEDNGEGILFNVFCYNVQPGVEIDYTTGKSHASEDAVLDKSNQTDDILEDAVQNSSENNPEVTYILNINTKKFHRPDCSSLSRTKEENKETFTGSKDNLIQQGYEACKNCNP